MTTKRKYKRRTDEERIAELEARIAEIREREKKRKAQANPIVREIPKVQKRLQKFAQMAMDHSRPDIANTTTAFVTTLGRILTAESQPKNAQPSGDA